jgi:hypothetical protein
MQMDAHQHHICALGHYESVRSTCRVS